MSQIVIETDQPYVEFRHKDFNNISYVIYRYDVRKFAIFTNEPDGVVELHGSMIDCISYIDEYIDGTYIHMFFPTRGQYRFSQKKIARLNQILANFDMGLMGRYLSFLR